MIEGTLVEDGIPISLPAGEMEFGRYDDITLPQ